MLLQAPFVNRTRFAEYLNWRDLTGFAAEIGTHRGVFADQFMDRWMGARLYCIDPWINGYADDPAAASNRDSDYEATATLLDRYGGRIRLLKETSDRAVRHFDDNSLDFVYIDGNHLPEYFHLDLTLWWPKIRPQGILAGHDFLCPNEVDGGWGKGIQEKLLPFAALVERDIHIVLEETNDPWSFYLIK